MIEIVAISCFLTDGCSSMACSTSSEFLFSPRSISCCVCQSRCFTMEHIFILYKPQGTVNMNIRRSVLSHEFHTRIHQFDILPYEFHMLPHEFHMLLHEFHSRSHQFYMLLPLSFTTHTQQKTHNLFWPDENSIEQCFAAHIVQGCQQY